MTMKTAKQVCGGTPEYPLVNGVISAMQSPQNWARHITAIPLHCRRMAGHLEVSGRLLSTHMGVSADRRTFRPQMCIASAFQLLTTTARHVGSHLARVVGCIQYLNGAMTLGSMTREVAGQSMDSLPAGPHFRTTHALTADTQSSAYITGFPIDRTNGNSPGSTTNPMNSSRSSLRHFYRKVTSWISES